MAYYESPRAAKSMGVPNPSKIVTTGTSKMTIPILGLGTSLDRTMGEERTQDLAESIDTYLRRVDRKRSVARSLHDAVQATQLIDITIDLAVGKMPFLRIPGSKYSTNAPQAPKAVWAIGEEINAYPRASTELILLGSLDGLVGPAFDADDARIDDFSFPSDPGAMTGAVIEAMGLDVEREDYMYEMQWETDPDMGESARLAHEINVRASAPGPTGSTWVERRLPAQRVVGSITDIWTSRVDRRTILARPALIQSTI